MHYKLLAILITTFIPIYSSFAITNPEAKQIAPSNTVNVPDPKILAEARRTFTFGYNFYQKKDTVRAANWLERAANLGHPQAMALLAIIYSRKSAQQNYIRAYQWAYLYMQSSRDSRLFAMVIPWLSLDDIDSGNKQVLRWLESKKPKPEVLQKIKAHLASILKKAETEDLVDSTTKTLYLDNSWVMWNSFFLNY